MNSLLPIFDEIPCTIVQGLWPTNLKFGKKSNFDRNQLKLSTQHNNIYMYKKFLLPIFDENTMNSPWQEPMKEQRGI